ncbi:uncharacterized protein LOC119671197 [Teleopsis dalmanni]|uniref:uncharacterized protein LOC119671197 n=1 Tax=Teleopsis dalmanni TaxID=139649 RepID=UPI0018CFAF23|nr:uncharacterized protein LOC119671197 [Teleopsis dalmanni]
MPSLIDTLRFDALTALSVQPQCQLLREADACQTCRNMSKFRKGNPNLFLSCQINNKKSAKNIKYCDVNKQHKSKFGVFLIIFFVISVQTTHGIPVTPSGQRLIRHTPQYRHQYHQKLLQDQRTRLQPTPPHKHHLHLRAAPNMNCNEGVDAVDIRSILKHPYDQANASFTHLRQVLDEYAKIVQNAESAQNVRVTWRLHHVKWDHQLKADLTEDFDVDPKVNNVYLNALRGDLNLTRIKNELKKYNETLTMLKAEVKKVISYHNANKDEKYDKNKYIADFFEKFSLNLERDLEECKLAMATLCVKESTVEEPDTKYEGGDLDNWLIIQEYLRLTHFMSVAYEIMRDYN